jgi:pimeloyl-ACP methyl ester carboxylesterase
MTDAPAAPPALTDAPLAPFAGAVPPAPPWFSSALADAPEVSTITVAGAGIEVLTWGERGKPGLLLLHGNGAHAGWWRFIAPFFAAKDGGDYRVAAFSWSGMGGSDHRATYSVETFVDEIFAVVAATGLADAGPPIVVGHSFGGFPMMAAVKARGAEFAAAVIVDTPFRAAGEPGHRPPNATERRHKVYPTLTAALARFRFAPVQGCANPFIADRIARDSLVEVPVATDDGAAATGWTWRFDPFLWGRFHIGDALQLLANPRCPVALVWGANSMLMPPDRVAAMRDLLPPGTPAIAIPEAEHHVMVDQPLAFVAALRGLFAGWPAVPPTA